MSEIPTEKEDNYLKDIEVEQDEQIEKRNNNTFINNVPPFAGFWMRFWAYLLDLVVISSLNRIIVHPVFRALDVSLYESKIFSPINIITAITFYIYFVLMTKYLGQTIGKMVFGLKVINLKGDHLSWGTVLFREWIGRFISTTVLILYILVAFMPKKQGIHDLFSDTSVVHERNI